MQTLEPQIEEKGDAQPRRMSRGLIVALGGMAAVALAVASVWSRLGILVMFGLAIVAFSLVFTFYRGFSFIQALAFLIHFDGVGRGAFTLGRVLSVMVFALIAYKLIVEKWRPPAIPVRHWLPVLALVTWAVISGAWSPVTTAYLLGLGQFGLAVAFFAATMFLVDDESKVQQFLRAYWWGGIFGAVAGIWGLVLGLRAYGFNGDANLFGVVAASMIPLTIYYRRRATTPSGRFAYTLVLLLVLGGAAGAGSRSGVIGASLVLFVSIVWKPGRSWQRGLLTAVPAAVVTFLVAVILLVLNPNTLIRGTDSSGRTDFWRVSVASIADRPLVGYGLGQLSVIIPDRLATTPGSERLTDKREAVSSHNTWLDITGDLGFIGLTLWTPIIVVSVIALLRPHWEQNRETQQVLMMMFIPVLSGSLFLNMYNNKLGWSVMGLAAVMQVPSWSQRYRGWFSADDEDDKPPPRWAPDQIARWDVKVSQRFRTAIGAGALIGAVVLGAIGASSPAKHTASMSMLVPELDLPPNVPFVSVDRDRLQVMHTVIISEAYAYELSRLSGVEVMPDEIASGVSVSRPDAGAFMTIEYADTDAERVQMIGPHLLAAFDALIENGRAAAEPELRDELRPTVPGEQRYYTGPMFIPVSTEAEFGVEPPRVTWMAFVGALSGAVVASGFVLLQQYRPRVNNSDDFPKSVGMPLWTHVGRNTRVNGATPAQFSQVAIRAFEACDGDEWPRRIVVASPDTDRSAQYLVMGLSAALAASGQRVVLVDGQAERPMLSRRLGGWNRPGIVDVCEGSASLGDAVRRVNRWRLSRTARRTLGDSDANLRLVPAGIRRGTDEPTVDPHVLDALDDDVIVVMLAPPMLGSIPVAATLQWADVVLHSVVEGRTVTFEAEDAGVQVRTFSTAPAGVVLSDV